MNAKTHAKKVAKLQLYVRTLADAMKLRDWEVEVSAEDTETDGMAECHCVFGRKVAQIRLSLDFWKQSPEEKRQTICHELIHAHFAPMHNPLDKELYSPANSFYRSAMEYGVDALADVIAPSMPLPPK